MRLTINSSLPLCQRPESGQLSPFQTAGIVTELALNHSDYDALSVEQTLARLLPALESGNAKVFFDDDYRPYGYASWLTLADEVQQSLLGSADNSAVDTTHYFHMPSGPNLWFMDLLCPFTSPLSMLHTLKKELTDHDSAHLIPHRTDKNTATRRLW